MVMMIDPPEGWRYGFPRRYNDAEDGNMRDFLLKHGYPEKDVDFAMNNMGQWFPEEDAPNE